MPERSRNIRKKIAIKFNYQTWTFEHLEKFSNRVANYFSDKGFRYGNEIGLLMKNCPEYIGIWLGLSKIGVITALINTNLKLDLLINTLSTFNCQALIF